MQSVQIASFVEYFGFRRIQILRKRVSHHASSEGNYFAVPVENREHDTVKELIVQEQDKIMNLDWSKKSENDIAQSCKQKFQNLKNQYANLSCNYIKILSSISSKLDEKYSNSLFASLSISFISKFPLF